MSSSVVISRASDLVEGRVAWFHGLGSGMRDFKWALAMSPFSHVEKTWGGQLTGPFFMYHDQRSRHYNRYLAWEPDESGAMRIKLEIIHSLYCTNHQMDHSLHKNQHTFRTTAQGVNCPAHGKWNWGLCLWGPSSPSPLTEHLWCLRAPWVACYCCGHNLAWI